MQYDYGEELEKELEFDATDDSDSIDLEGAYFDTEVEWRKDIGLNSDDENILEVCFENLFPCAK